MFRYAILVLLLFGYIHNSIAQTLNRTIEWPAIDKSSLNWNKGSEEESPIKPFLWFNDNLDFLDQSTMLPVYSEIISLSNPLIGIDQISIKVQNKIYIALTIEERKLIEHLPLKTIEDQEEGFDVFRSRGKSYLSLRIPTIRANSVTGVIEKLVSFELIIGESFSPVPGNLTLKSTVFKSTSALATGSWKMIAVEKTGIHRITFSELQSMGFSNIDNVSIWGHGGKQLPYWNSEPFNDDIVQIPILIEKGSDGIFNQGDYILFYAQGNITWRLDNGMIVHSIHDYADKINYFITTSKSNPLRIELQNQVTQPHTRISNSYDALAIFEKNDTNLIKSGRQWFGESFDIYTSRTYNTGFNKPINMGKAKVRVRVAARSAVSSSYTLRANGISLGSISLPSVNTGDQYSNFASVSTRTFEFDYNQGSLSLELTYNKPTPAAKGWLDFITVNARQTLEMGSSQLLFRDLESVGVGEITKFSVANIPSNLYVWDVTNFFEPKAITFNSLSTTAEFTLNTDVLKEFVAFSPSQVYTPVVLGDVPNQNIHGEPQPEMVIVSHPNFMSQANELAQIHFENSGLRSIVVSNQQVYNEFSSGNPDVTAIRNMMRMFYSRATSELDMPKYLLLFGDGSYDNRSQKSTNSNFILTYQSENSLHVTNSFVSDDFFGLLDENEGEATGLLDIGIGRIPSSTVDEANLVVRKIRQYLSPSSYGSWHNQLCFIGDDGDGNLHMRDANRLAEFVEENYPIYNIDKIYFDSYPLITTSQGGRYPDVTTAINNRANQGTLIMNYVGHANAIWLAHEKVLMISDIQSWRNFDRLPLFVTATCEFSRFDDFSRKSAGEHALLAPYGGSVALLSTSRVVYANPNYTLSRNFFENVFKERDGYVEGSGDRYYRLGDVLRMAKVATSGQINKRNFLLLGDPALMLQYPNVDLSISEINGVSVGGDLDTLKALSRVDVKGGVDGSKFGNEFSGEAEILLFDKVKEITTLSNRGGLPFVYTTRNNTIYKGRSSIVNGQFKSSFIIPKDIMYSFGKGRFSLFAHDGYIKGSGVFEDFIVGGISQNIGDDTVGPDIDLYMNSTKFVSGGITDKNPKLIVHLTDSSGINTTGVGIGHDLTAYLKGDEEKSFVLNDYYVAEVDDYQKGKVEYQFSDLNPGNYSVRLKAWDIFNNSSESSIDFIVKTDASLTLRHVLNYPNPFTESTGFYFEHNQPFESFDVTIQIFSPSGKLVKTLDAYYTGDGGYRIGPIYWDGLDDFGDRIGRGVYFYRLNVRLSSGKSKHVFQKLVILK
jgi:hypothetical protein